MFCSEVSVPPTNFDEGGTDRKMVTSTPTKYLVELTKFAPLLLAELTGIWSLLWGGTQLRMFTFNTCTVLAFQVKEFDRMSRILC